MHYVLGRIVGNSTKIGSAPALLVLGCLDIYATAYKLRLKEAISTDR